MNATIATNNKEKKRENKKETAIAVPFFLTFVFASCIGGGFALAHYKAKDSLRAETENVNSIIKNSSSFFGSASSNSNTPYFLSIPEAATAKAIAFGVFPKNMVTVHNSYKFSTEEMLLNSWGGNVKIHKDKESGLAVLDYEMVPKSDCVEFSSSIGTQINRLVVNGKEVPLTRNPENVGTVRDACSRLRNDVSFMFKS